MNKILFLFLVYLSMALSSSCYNGCATCDGVICLSCNIPNTVIDSTQRACICQNGYYASSINPITCNLLIQGQAQTQCEVDLGLNVADFYVIPQCYFYTENPGVAGSEINYIRSDVQVDTSHSLFSDSSCRFILQTQIQYRPAGYNYPSIDQNYVALPVPSSGISYTSVLPGGNQGDQRIQIPLIDVYNLAYSSTQSTDGTQIVQILNFRIQIGSINNIIYRSHRWQSSIYTNRNQVQTFTLEVDIQQTSGCAAGQDCIVIADLDVTGSQYKSDWVTAHSTEYTVGDSMYMRIWFKDPSYTKQLSFQKLYFLNSSNQVFDFTTLVDQTNTGWNHADNSLHVELPLIQPSTSATIQINMLVETANARLRALRQLQSSSSSTSSSSSSPSSTISQQFTVTVISPLPTSTDTGSTSSSSQSSNHSSKSCQFMLIFGLLNIVSFMLLF